MSKIVLDGRSKAAREAKLKEKYKLQAQHTGANTRQVGGSHYTENTVQPWDAMESWMSPEQFVGFLRGNAIKYLARCEAKGGLEDVRKAQHYIDKMIETMEGV